MRPPEPENASAIGFSDSLWNFVQRCWDGQMELRPKVAEVVSQLKRAAADWDGVMPPCAQVERVVPACPEPVSDSMEHCKLCILIFPWFDPLNNGIGGIFVGLSPGVIPKSPTKSQAFPTLFDPPSTLPARRSKLPTYTSAEIPTAARRQSPPMHVHRFENGHHITFFQPLLGASAALG